MTRREALSRMAIALALAAVGIPLVGPWLARWAAAQERKRLILAQLQRQAEEATRGVMERMGRQLYGDPHGVITEIDHALGTITVAWDQPGAYVVRERLSRSSYGLAGFHVGEPVVLV